MMECMKCGKGELKLTKIGRGKQGLACDKCGQREL